MSLPVPVVWSEDCLRHEPGGEVWLGLREPGTEVPARARVLRDALAAAGAPVTAAREHDDTVLREICADRAKRHERGRDDNDDGDRDDVLYLNGGHAVASPS